PFFGLMFVFVILTFIYGLIVSCTDAQGINPGDYIGLQNFRAVLSDDYFWRAIFVSFKFMIVCIITQLPAAILLAVWLQSIPYKRIRGVLQAAFFVPFLMNTVVTALLFRMLVFGEPGIANWILGALHLPHDFRWMFDKGLSFPLLTLVAFWQGIGFQAVYFHAYLQTIDPSIHEAARIDGASRRKIFFSITIPLMRPAITFMMVTIAIGSLLVFDLVYMLFQWGINENVATILIYIYGKAFHGDFNIGLAAAAGWVAFFIILAVSLLQIRFLGLGREREE
ncbi:MAG TPA: sugar ABC transporter permease, partial [Spirochaetota bacterium]